MIRLTLLAGVLGLLLPGRVLSQPATLPYTLQTELTVSGLANDDNFGRAVAVEGNTLVVGAFGEDEFAINSGAAYVFERNGGAWVRTQRLAPDPDRGSTGGYGFGVAVALDGEWMVIGAWGAAATNASGDDVAGAGVVHVFRHDGNDWAEAQILQRSEPEFFELFGSSVAISANTIAVGSDEGAAVDVFEWDGSLWVRQASLIPNDFSGERFRSRVAINEDASVIVAGAPQHNATFTREGSVFVFVRDGANWVEQPRLAASDPGQNRSFGGQVSISGEVIVATANLGLGDPGGAVHVFERGTGGWSHQARLTASVPTAGDSFGSTLVIRDGLIATGASVEEAVYIFEHGGAGWTLRDKITAIPSLSNLALRGPWLVVGSTGGTGAATVYTAYSDPAVLADYLGNLLYHPHAVASGTFDPNQSAFRYKHLLYGPEDGDIRARHEMMPDFYGPAERRRADFAEAEVVKGLFFDADNAALGNLLLDIYYDRATAETILAKNLEEDTERARFGPPLAEPPPASGFIIDNEIPLLRDLLATGRTAMAGYFALLSDDLGLPGDPPRGYTLFRDLVPDRALMAATYDDGGGGTVAVTDEPMLFSGYKDLVLLFELLRDHGRAAHSLARLLVARDAPGDLDEAKTLIAESERFLYLQGSLLESIFPALPEPEDPSGLAQAIAGWSGALESLANLRQIIAGDANLLGFAPDFLMLIENFTGPGSDIFDSFDVFKERLSLNTLDSTLRRARDRLQTARDAFDQFRGYEGQILEQFDQSTISYEFRLFEIVGARPGEANYSDIPTANPGSELDQQYRSIELARLKIQRNQTEIDNLAREVQIEINRAADVSQVFIRYGNQQADITERIGHIKATQAAANALADVFSAEKILSGASVAVLLNGAVQAGAEVGIGNLEADKERLAAAEQAEVEGINSAARVKTLLLGMQTLAVDSAEAALLLRQEIARMAALDREKAELEGRIADLASRYFADPIHRVAADWRMVEANLGFEEAQRWLFFMVRALEFKWNTPFSGFAHDGRTWSARTLFKLRNADELEAFFNAMNAFDALINRGKTFRFDWFSVREDFMGLKTLDDEGQPAEYIDPVTGETHDAIGMFRAILGRSVRPVQGGQEIVVEFNTVRQIPGGFFFVGPTFNLDGSVSSPGRFLNKIDYLQIRLPGDHTLGRAQLAGNLTYGGTSFIRNFNVGHFDPDRPDRLVNEMTAYSTRYWFFDPTAGQQRWKFNEGLTIDAVEMQLSDDPRLPPTVNQILEFKERSVAATGWRLTIPLVQQNTRVLMLEELNDIEIYFHHYSAQRQ